MIWTYSRQSLKFIELAYKYSTFIAIAPNYDFNKRTYVKENAYKLYCSIVAIIIIFGCVHQQYFYFSKLSITHTPFAFVLVLFSQFIIFVSCVLIVLSSAFWNKKNWGRLFESFWMLENNLNTTSRTEHSFLKNFYFQFFLIQLLLMVILTNALMSWFLYIIHPNPLILMTEIVHLYLLNMKFMKVKIVYNIALAIKCKYQDLNSLLMKGCCREKSELLKTVGTVSYLCSVLGETVIIFNRLFGWDILLLIFHSTITVLACFNFVKMYFSEVVSEPHTPPIHLISNFFTLCIASLVSGTI